MGEDSEKRFQEAMDKLFHAPPKSKPESSGASSGVQLSRGKKRPDMASAFAYVDPKSRGRAIHQHSSLATNVSGGGATMCRPWDRDDLFRRIATFKSMTWFAKPQAISAVNCARRGWINVAMDTIACEACGSRMLFSTPPSWTQQQVEKTAMVFSLKLDSGHKLLCPWIDNACDEKLADFPPTATDVLVDQYKVRHSVLSQLVALPIISPKAIGCLRSPQLEQFLQESFTADGDESMGTRQKEDITNELSSVSSLTYYQAQKLISLCGWELRTLPYLVDSSDQLDRSSKDNLSDKALLSGKNQSITVYRSCSDKTLESRSGDVCQGTEEATTNPNSVVLECRLCGACIGLWEFSMVPRPMEFLRVIGYTQVNDDHSSQTHGGNTLLSGNSNRYEGGEQSGHAATSGNAMVDTRPPLKLTIAGGPPPATQDYRAKIAFPIIGRNLRAWVFAESELKGDLVIKRSSGVSQTLEMLAEANTKEGTSLSKSDSVTDSHVENCQVTTHVSSNTNDVIDNAESMGKVASACMGHCKGDAVIDIGSSETDEVTRHEGQSSGVMVEGNNFSQDGERGSGNDVVISGLHPLTHNISPGQGRELQNLSLDRVMEFDPFRLHRHFCPWIASHGGCLSGWKQVLSALERHEKSSSPLSNCTPSSLIKVDDPVASVRKLFTSPPSKRKKLIRPS